MRDEINTVHISFDDLSGIKSSISINLETYVVICASFILEITIIIHHTGISRGAKGVHTCGGSKAKTVQPVSGKFSLIPSYSTQ